MVNPLASKKQYKVLDGRDEWEGLAAPGEPTLLELPYGASVCAIGLRLLDEEINISQWSEVGAKLSTMEYGLQWAIGDWWAYGYRRYGDKAHKIVEKLPYTKESVMNLGTVARSVPPSLRNEALSFSHHVAVAPLGPKDQDRWLKKAAALKWSVKNLRKKINKAEMTDEGFDRPKWAAYLIKCAQRPREMVPLDESGELENLEDGLLRDVAAASAQAAERWTKVANATKKLLENHNLARPRPTKRNRVRESISEHHQAS